MEDTQSRHSETYQQARSQFDQLRLEEKAEFLVEAMLVTIGRGLETAGETISREMEGILTNVRDSVRNATRTPGAAEGAAPDVAYDDMDASVNVDDITPPGGASPGTAWDAKENPTDTDTPSSPGA